MRIGMGGIRHETNSFSNVPTTVELFRKLEYSERQETIDCNRGVRSYIGGIIDEAQELGVTLAPALFANANPSGRITPETLSTLRDRLVELLWEAHQQEPLDAIALTLHGAGAAGGCHDIEGEVLRAVRQRFGKDIPVGVVLDLHANVTEQMMEHSDILLGVKCYPHVDEYESARVMLGLLCDIARTGKKPCKKLVRLPWHLAPAGGVTIQGPAHEVQQLTLRLEREDPQLRQVTFFHGFAYADIPQTGVTVTAFGDTQEAADRAALAVARFAWERRHTFQPKPLSPQEAFDLAEAVDHGPVVINESSDNPGGGSPGDGTHLLREMLRRNLPGTAFGHICDPEVARMAAQAGVGSRISCKLGAKTDDLHGEPIQLTDAYVKCVCDGRFITRSPMGGGGETNLGLTVRLKVGNVDIVVSSLARQTKDLGPFEVVGINVFKMRILALKSSQHFRGWWQDKASAIIPCDPPGIHCSDLSVFDFRYANTSYFPLGDAQWDEV